MSNDTKKKLGLLDGLEGVVDTALTDNKEDQKNSKTFDPQQRELLSLQKQMKNIPEFARIFDGSLDEHKAMKNSTWLYSINNKRMDFLKNVLPNVTKTDAVNYIINAYFQKYATEIKKEHQKKNKDVF